MWYTHWTSWVTTATTTKTTTTTTDEDEEEEEGEEEEDDDDDDEEEDCGVDDGDEYMMINIYDIRLMHTNACCTQNPTCFFRWIPTCIIAKLLTVITSPSWVCVDLFECYHINYAFVYVVYGNVA